MSLTGVLQNRKDENCLIFQEEIKKITPSKNEFKVLKSDNNPFDTKRELKVNYNLNGTIEASLVGTAFDYLARFRIAQIVTKNNTDAIKGIVASEFFSRFEDRLTRKIYNKLIDRYNNTIVNIEKTIVNKIPFNEWIIEDVCILARLENCWRGDKLPNNRDELFSKPSNEVRRELIELINLFEWDFVNKVVKPDSKVIYNPSFGEASQAIGGADADIYIDGTLYDFKTTKVLGYRSKDIQQIMGYYVLNEIGKKRSTKYSNNTLGANRIERVAIYSARVGEINYFNINKLDINSINNVINKIEGILFNRLNHSSKGLKKLGSKNRRIKRKKIIFTIAVIIMILIGTIFVYKNNQSKVYPIEGEVVNQSTVENDIELDYENRKKDISEVLTKGQGFFRYYSGLVNILRSYDVSNIDDARTVYKLSDNLLNNMYQGFQQEWNDELFNELTEAQLIWIDDKMKVEEKLKDDDLLRYQTLIDITLDKCEEWTEYYK